MDRVRAHTPLKRCALRCQRSNRLESGPDLSLVAFALAVEVVALAAVLVAEKQ